MTTMRPKTNKKENEKGVKGFAEPLDRWTESIPDFVSSNYFITAAYVGPL